MSTIRRKSTGDQALLFANLISWRGDRLSPVTTRFIAESSLNPTLSGIEEGPTRIPKTQRACCGVTSEKRSIYLVPFDRRTREIAIRR
jgi:hypothetical protein